ncbi:MAG: hypothetical protein WBA57_10275 [Elainellaceae cyanobacterium]
MPPVDIRQQAISLIEQFPPEQLPQNKLEAVVQLLEVLTESIVQSVANTDESHLREIIQCRLPEAKKARLNELRYYSSLQDEKHISFI